MNWRGIPISYCYKFIYFLKDFFMYAKKNQVFI